MPRHRSRKFAIPINERNMELIKFLNHRVEPFDRGEGNYYFTFTINVSGQVANRRVQRAEIMYDIDQYESFTDLFVITPA